MVLYKYPKIWLKITVTTNFLQQQHMKMKANEKKHKVQHFAHFNFLSPAGLKTVYHFIALLQFGIGTFLFL